MPLESHWEPKGLHRRFHGVVGAREIKASNDRVYGDRRFDDMRYHVADFLDATEVLLAPKELKIFAALDNAAARTNGRIRLAIVVRDERLVELARIYKRETRGKGWPVEIFGDLESARAWARAEEPARR